MRDGPLNRWDEARQTLTDLLAWIEDSRQWVAAAGALEAPCAPDLHLVAQGSVPGAAAAPEMTTSSALPEADTAPPDLFALLAALTALRHEVKLQTRTARHDQEQAAGALEQLSTTVAQLERLQQDEASRREAAVQEAQRVAADTLLELHDALSRSVRQAEQILASVGATLRAWSVPRVDWEHGGTPCRGETLPETPEQAAVAFAETGPVRVTWLRRWFGRPVPRPTGAVSSVETQESVIRTSVLAALAELHQIRSGAAPMADRLEGLAEGVRLNAQRLERALATYGIEPIECLGKPVDAALMEVVQIIADPTQPVGVVLDEVRRGYRRHGRVYRFAQVVATRVTPPADRESPLTEAQDTPAE